MFCQTLWDELLLDTSKHEVLCIYDKDAELSDKLQYYYSMLLPLAMEAARSPEAVRAHILNALIAVLDEIRYTNAIKPTSFEDPHYLPWLNQLKRCAVGSVLSDEFSTLGRNSKTNFAFKKFIRRCQWVIDYEEDLKLLAEFKDDVLDIAIAKLMYCPIADNEYIPKNSFSSNIVFQSTVIDRIGIEIKHVLNIHRTAVGRTIGHG